MSKVLRQIRYYGDNANLKNTPPGLTWNQLFSGEAFQEYYPLYQIGVQGLPGTKFYLNDSLYPVVLGSTGIYELEDNGQSQVVSLSFDKAALEKINSMDSLSAGLIIDIMGTRED